LDSGTGVDDPTLSTAPFSELVEPKPVPAYYALPDSLARRSMQVWKLVVSPEPPCRSIAHVVALVEGTPVF
jgi:hypothetical protein